MHVLGGVGEMLLWLVGSVVICLLLMAACIALYDRYVDRRDKHRQYERAQRRIARATAKVKQTFKTAEIRMEEAAGYRIPGERRMDDGLIDDWRSW